MSAVLILPDGLETSDCVVLNNIYRVPKDVGEYKYISYHTNDSNGLNFYENGDNCEARLNKNSIIIENPIAGWSEEEIVAKMFECMFEQPDEWMQEYYQRILKCYKTASENSEFLGYEHFLKMTELKEKYRLN